MSSRPQTPTARSLAARGKSARSSGVFRAIGSILPSPKVHYPKDVLPLESEENKARLQAMADAFATLQKNMESLAATHNAVNQFNESFASLFLGLQVHMFCNSFPGIPSRERYEALKLKKSTADQNAELKAKIKAARRQNAELKEQVSRRAAESRQKSHLGDLFSQRSAREQNVPTSRPFALPSARRKIPVARDDSYSTMDSFIDAPGSKQQGNVRKGLAAARAGQSPANASPNLNQPPRYMRGLFEVASSANQRRIGPARSSRKPGDERPDPKKPDPEKPAKRRALGPPKFAQHGSARGASSQRPAGWDSSDSERAAASRAAHRAQLARANRMAARPPFR